MLERSRLSAIARGHQVPKLHGGYNFGYTAAATGAGGGGGQPQGKPSLMVRYTYWPEWWKKDPADRTR